MSNVTRNVTKNVTRKRHQKIFDLIANNPFITRRELIDAIGINQSAIQKHINVLIKDGFLERKGQTNGSYYIILKKYK